MYATFGSKVALLDEVVRRAARGGDEAEILEQAGPARASRRPPTSASSCASSPTTSPARLARVGAAPRRRRERRGERARARRAVPAASTRRGFATCARLPAALARNGPLRVDEETAAETIWALASPDLYALLTGVRGWTRERYTAWLADSLAAILLLG